MTRLSWISAAWRRQRNTPTPGLALAPAASAARLPRDEEEQDARIKNLAADTDLKEQALAHARIQLVLAIMTVVVALGSLVVGAVTLYLDHQNATKSRHAFILLSPCPHKLV